MKAIIVNEEELVCIQLRKMLQETGAFQLIKTYGDPDEALQDRAVKNIDVAFLEIEMSKVSGMQLAESLQAKNEKIQIVFTTAFDRFAVKAFELNAVDYLLKPILKSRLEQTVQRLLNNYNIFHFGDWTDQEMIGIECFDSLKFYIISGGKKVYLPVKWRTMRARELYIYLLLHYNRFVSKERLINDFWPEMDFAKASTRLYTTIYQIRKLIDELPIPHRIIKNEIGYALITYNSTVDTVEWEKSLDQLQSISLSTYPQHIKLFKAYKNHYLAEYGYIWAEGERMRLAQVWMEHAYRLIAFLVQEKRYAEALGICQQIDQIEPNEVQNMKFKIMLYNKMGNVEGAIQVYAQYKDNEDAISKI